VKIEIRVAIESDLDWLCVELKKFDDFYGSRKRLFEDEAYVRGALLSMIDKHVLIVAEVDRKPAGFIGGLVGTHFYNPNIKRLDQIFWWVMPTFRNSRVASTLLSEFIEFGKAQFDWVTLNLSVKCGIKESTLRRIGFELADNTYLLENV